jgi:hypothetical protein
LARAVELDEKTVIKLKKSAIASITYRGTLRKMLLGPTKKSLPLGYSKLASEQIWGGLPI